MTALRKSLEDCVKTETPVIAVVAVIGSTEESSVDNLAEIVSMRKEFRNKGLDFAIHCDAAWGGYFASMIRHGTPPPIGGVEQPSAPAVALMTAAATADPSPAWPMSDYVREQFQALHHADSITVDPHKGGYIPYPAGALCYSNSSMRNMISLKSPVVFHNEAEPTVGIFGIEGSKPGAAAAAVWLAHRVIRPTREGYGAILERCMWTATRHYCRLVTMQQRHSWLKVVPFTRLPIEREGADQTMMDAEIKRIATFAVLPNDQFQNQIGVGEFGPDLVINAFACNFHMNGMLNTDFDKLNMLNDRIYELCSATVPKDYRDDDTLELMLTGSSFDPGDYGQPFVDAFCKKLGVTSAPGKKVSFLIATSMDPWRTNTSAGDFLKNLEEAFVKAAATAIKQLGGDTS